MEKSNYQASEKNKDHEKALQKAHEALEQKVNERTAELLEANKQLQSEIEERKKVEEVLYLREQEYRTLVENAPDIIFRFDRKFRHTYVNEAVEKATGIPKQSFIGKDHRELGMPEDIVLFFQKHIRKVFESGKELKFKFAFPSPTGENHFESWYVPEFSKNGTVEHVMGITRDITKQKQTENALKESNHTKDKFFSIISHDLRSPFSALLGFSKMLEEKYDKYDSKKQKKFIKIIHQGLQDTYKLLENLLYWSSSQRGTIDFEPEKVNLHIFLNKTSSLLSQAAENKSIELINQIQDNIFVNADPEMLSTIIRNLISNAIKFTPKGGRIEIMANLIKSSSRPDIVEIKIKDNGIGIAEDLLSKLFNIGEHASMPGTENEKGTGLGLILCKEFVEKHGGDIWINSEIEKGSEFIFTLPVFSK